MTMGELYPPFRVLSSDRSLPLVVSTRLAPTVAPRIPHSVFLLAAFKTPCISWVFSRCIYLVGTSSSTAYISPTGPTAIQLALRRSQPRTNFPYSSEDE